MSTQELYQQAYRELRGTQRVEVLLAIPDWICTCAFRSWMVSLHVQAPDYRAKRMRLPQHIQDHFGQNLVGSQVECKGENYTVVGYHGLRTLVCRKDNGQEMIVDPDQDDMTMVDMSPIDRERARRRLRFQQAIRRKIAQTGGVFG